MKLEANALDAISKYLQLQSESTASATHFKFKFYYFDKLNRAKRKNSELTGSIDRFPCTVSTSIENEIILR